MRIIIISFTSKGYGRSVSVSEALEKLYPQYETELVFKGERSIRDVCSDAFAGSVPLIFIGAAGIAVRAIAPFVKDKLTDPPVIVADESGSFVIPLLSGHVGGANELAQQVADVMDAVPVVTTATDINSAFSVDLFAKENGLTIKNREGIARVSSSALEGKPVTICIKDYPPQCAVDVLVSDDPGDKTPGAGALRDMASIVLCPKRYAIGIGCRRGKPFEEIRDFVSAVLAEAGIDIKDAGCIATIDIKKDEEGLKALSQAWRMPLITFEADILARACGEFTSSQRVLESVGVDNVCERAAVLAAGTGSELIIRKTAHDGMTAAVAQKKNK